jgi:Immune inhibitor A peptidase M6/zinc-ribbon domain/IPT/TIG domain
MQRCPNCHWQIPDDADSCSYCGQRLHPDSSADEERRRRLLRVHMFNVVRRKSRPSLPALIGALLAKPVTVAMAVIVVGAAAAGVGYHNWATAPIPSPGNIARSPCACFTSYTGSVDPLPLSVNIARSHAAPPTTVLSEDFETGAPGWTTTGFWHIQDHPETISVKSPDINPTLVTLPDSGQLPAAYSGTHAAWFGEASTGTYCGSDFNTIPQTSKDGCTSTQPYSGELTSPPFSLAGATSAEVQFQAWWEIESVNADTYDLMTVEYSIDGGASWQQAGKLNPVNNPAGKHDQDYTANGIEKPAQWTQDIVDISGAAGQSNVQIRFKFDTGDIYYQGFRGWLVDNVVVSTPFVSPNPSVASIKPSCVSSSASIAVDVIGSNFVSGSTVLLDGSDAGGAVLSAQRIEFTANNLTVGNHTVQVVSPNGAMSNTATLTSARSCSQPSKTLFVLIGPSRQRITRVRA